MSSADIIPFHGRKPLPGRPGSDAHPLPWTYGNGFLWDANRRMVGSTIEKPTAEWIARCVNAHHGQDTAEHVPDANPA